MRANGCLPTLIYDTFTVVGSYADAENEVSLWRVRYEDGDEVSSQFHHISAPSVSIL